MTSYYFYNRRGIFEEAFEFFNIFLHGSYVKYNQKRNNEVKKKNTSCSCKFTDTNSLVEK